MDKPSEPDRFANLNVDDIEFVDELPPPAGPWDGMHRRQVQEWAERLKQNPGRWAIYPWTSTNVAGRALASRISRGKNQTFSEGFHAVFRRGMVYVRYEGGSCPTEPS